MKRYAVVISLFVLLAASVCAFADITVGIDLSTTGPMASVGIEFRNAALLGPSTIAGEKVRYIFLDNNSDPTTAVQNAKRLISESNIDVLIGPPGSSLALAVLDPIAQAKVPTLCLASASAIVSPMDEKRKWMFKAVANDDVFVAAMVRHMATVGVKTLSLIVSNDPYGESWANETNKIAPAKGIKVVRVERFERTDNSTTPQALRIMGEKPDAVLIVAVGTPSVTPQRALVEHGYKGKLYQSGGAVSEDFLRLGGKYVEGTYLVQSPAIVATQLPNGYPTKKVAVDFLKLYQSKYGKSTYFGAQMWDELKLLEAAVPVALKSARPGTLEFREALRSALEQSKGVVGATAVFTMSPTDHTGINELGVSVIKVVNGTWKLEQAAAFK